MAPALSGAYMEVVGGRLILIETLLSFLCVARHLLRRLSFATIEILFEQLGREFRTTVCYATATAKDPPTSSKGMFCM
jgi:hypothetical protein